MKKIALAGFFLLLAVLGIAYISNHPSASRRVDAAEPGQSGAVNQAADTAATGTKWTTVRDTRENAFSIQVPQGWKTYGGLFRFSPIDTRMIVDMTSPDGLTNLRVGDSTVPPYRVPGPFLRIGPAVAAYTAGNVFAARYGQARFASICQGVRLTKGDALAPKYHPAANGISHTTAGEAFFSCTKNGAPMSAYVYAETMLLGPGGPGSILGGGGAGEFDCSGGAGESGRRDAAALWPVAGDEPCVGRYAEPVEQPGHPADKCRHAGDDRGHKC